MLSQAYCRLNQAQNILLKKTTLKVVFFIEEKNNKTMNNISLYLLTVLIWGSTWLAVEFQIGEVAPEVSIFYRYVIAAILIFLWSALKKQNLKFNLRTHLVFASLGLLLFCLNYICVYIGQSYITSALMAIVFSTVSWMNIFNARLFFGTRSGPRVLIGAFLGVVGLCFMFWPSISELSLTDVTVLGAVFGLVGSYFASLGNMISQATQKRKLPVMQTNAWSMLYGAMFTGLISLGRGHSFAIDWSFSYISSLLYLSIFGSVIAFWAYLTLLGRIGANKAGYTTIAFPVIAIILSVIFEDLKITMSLLVGVALVLIGNIFVMKRKQLAVTK